MTELIKEALPPTTGPNAPSLSHIALKLEGVLSDLLGTVGGCERILGTPIPLSYTRHTSRSLMLWLCTLPLALFPLMGWATVPAIGAISFIFMGIDEIGVEIEVRGCRFGGCGSRGISCVIQDPVFFGGHNQPRVKPTAGTREWEGSAGGDLRVGLWAGAQQQAGVRKAPAPAQAFTAAAGVPVNGG